MSDHHLVTTDGTIILPGTMLHATKGVHAGTHWRLEKIVHNGMEHMLRVSRYVRRLGRVIEHLHPSVFGLDIIEIKRWFRITRQDLAAFWRKIDEGLFMGLLSLLPLSVYDAMQGGEVAKEVIRAVFGR